MEIKLYTKKEAKEIIDKYPDKILFTKQVVVDIVENENSKSIYDAYKEKRMFYIVERVYYPGLAFTKVFIENE